MHETRNDQNDRNDDFVIASARNEDNEEYDDFHSVGSNSAFENPLFESAHSVSMDELEESSELGDVLNYESVVIEPNEIEISTCDSLLNKCMEDSMSLESDVLKSSETFLEEKKIQKESCHESDTSFLRSESWRVISESNRKTTRPLVNCVSLNQEKNCVSIGTERGYRIRTIETWRNDQVMTQDSEIPQGVSFCKMLNRTSLLAIVKSSSPRCLQMINSKNGSVIRELFFVAAVQRAEMNRKTLVVLSADGNLHIFELETTKLIMSIGILGNNESVRNFSSGSASGSFFALSTNDEEGWLACRSSENFGMIEIRDGLNMRLIGKLKAHTHPIARLSIGGVKGSQVLATASQKGTCIKIFSLPQCENLHTLWRGSTPCQIYSLAFSHHAKRIAVSGSKGTIHVFDISDSKNNNEKYAANDQSLRLPAYLLEAAVQGGHYLKSGLLADKINGMTEALRSFVKIKVNPDFVSGPTFPNVVVLLTCNEEGDTLILVNKEAYMYQYKIEGNRTTKVVTVDDLLFHDESFEDSTCAISIA